MMTKTMRIEVMMTSLLKAHMLTMLEMWKLCEIIWLEWTNRSRERSTWTNS